MNKCAVEICEKETVGQSKYCAFHRDALTKLMRDFFSENWEEIKLGVKVTTFCVKNPEAEKIVKNAIKKTVGGSKSK